MRLSGWFFGAILVVMTGLAQQAPPPPPAQTPDGAAGAQAAPDDAPGRPVARISVLSGEASVRRGDSGDWVAAALNAPLMAGDSLSVAAGGAAEIQLDYANFVRIAGDSEVRVSALDNGHYQVQLAKGLLTYRVLRDANTQPEVSTPLIAVRPGKLSAARVQVFQDGTTQVIVRHGDVEIYTPKGTEHAGEGNLVTVRGAADDPEYQMATAPGADQWDTWNDQRDAWLMRSQSSRYVSQDIAGADDLDAYGRWSYDPQYGNVWAPTVPDTWAPYRNGQWAWEDYYGWTWVDADPWGWAPFHYGSWYMRPGVGWCWFPGERFHHYWWHPALVGFVGFGGGFGVGFGFGNIGWIPLAPYERFHPWYGRGGFVGRNAFANNVNIVRNANITSLYRNARITNGVTAVTANDFQRGNFRNPVAVNHTQLQQASLMRGGLPVTPGAENLRFSNRAVSSSAPRADLSGQRFFSRSNVGGGSNGAGMAAAQRGSFTQQQAAVRAASRGSASSGWQRFNGTGSRGGGYAGGQRSLQVAPPIVHQREAQSFSAPSYSRGGGSFGAPSYRSAPAPAPAYRSAPAQAPAFRSAPAPSFHGGESGGGGHASSGGGGHSGGHR